MIHAYSAHTAVLTGANKLQRTSLLVNHTESSLPVSFVPTTHNKRRYNVVHIQPADKHLSSDSYAVSAK